MTVKMLQTMTTLITGGETTGVNAITVTATTQSKEYREFASFSRAIFYLDVSAASGTNPTLDVTIQEQDPISLKWRTVVTFPQQTTTTGGTPLTPQTLDPMFGTCYRANYAVGGTTPSFTCSLVAVLSCEEPVV